MAPGYPAESVSLRNASQSTVLLQAKEGEVQQVIGEVDSESAHWMVHPGAIYLHEGNTYHVEDLDLNENIARMHPVFVDYYTRTQIESSVSLLERRDFKEVEGGIKEYGELLVTTQVVGYQKIKWGTLERIGSGELSLPPRELQTMGYWVSLSDDTVNDLRKQGLWGSDYNRYGSNWNVQKVRARERDGFQCQNCGLHEEGRPFDVHHLIPFRAFSTSERANCLENLITLCSSCHRMAEGVVQIRSGLAGLGFTLGHLAPLFLMCDSRDIGVHTDPQSLLAEGRPVVVIFDRVPAGIGFSERLFELHPDLMNRAYELVNACECSSGCPSCVGPGGELGSGSKNETLALFKYLIEIVH
jgi:DEAD/DEAH box helicase domain-containing protein